MLLKKEYAEFDDTIDCKWTFSKHGTEYFKKCISKNDSCAFVVYIDNEIVGYLTGSLVNSKDAYRSILNYAELESTFVLERYRGIGIGSKLCQSFINWSKSKNISRLRVVASAQNIKGINFYRKNSFKDYDLILETNL
ncbi:MAG: GNAT family N-acetyltransferase [Patescibacteria group bacterium]|nr:GNAT family N-acetyltransferase [Patescibacteria group bacterium]